MITKGRYLKPDYDLFDTVSSMATEKGVSPSQIALAWLLHRDVTAPIIGATKVSHVEEAVASLDVKLTTGDLKRLEAHYRPQTVMIGT